VPKAVIYALHGYSGHSDRDFKNLVVRFAHQGYQVYAMDHEGHGKSDGLHVYISDFNNLVLDARQFIAETEASQEIKEGQKKKEICPWIIDGRWNCPAIGA